MLNQLSERRGSNSRPSAWEADALPTELLSLIVVTVSKCKATAGYFPIIFSIGYRIRTVHAVNGGRHDSSGIAGTLTTGIQSLDLWMLQGVLVTRDTDGR